MERCAARLTAGCVGVLCAEIVGTKNRGESQMKAPNVFRPCESDKLRVRRHVALTALATQVVFLFVLGCQYYRGTAETSAIIGATMPAVLLILGGLNAMVWLWFRAAYRIDVINAEK